MRAAEQRLFTQFPRSCTHVVALQSLTLWLASWVYLKRVADQVFCSVEPDRYYRHLGYFRAAIIGYPCAEPGQQSFDVRGFAYFAIRPHLSLRWHALSALNGVEELSETCIYFINLAFCLTTAIFPGSRVQRLLRRVLLVAPFFLHHLLTLLPLVALRPHIPSVLARLIPLRPLFVLYFALTGNHCLGVALAAAVALGSTMATTVLLLRAGVPLHYRPVPVLVHIALASLAAVGWAALWDGLLHGALLLRHLRLGRSTASGTSGLPRQQFLSMSTEGRLEAAATGSTCSSQAAPVAVPEGMALVVAAVMGQAGKHRHDGAVTSFSRRTAGIDGPKMENGGLRKWKSCTLRSRLGSLSPGLQSGVGMVAGSTEVNMSSFCLAGAKGRDVRDSSSCRCRCRTLGYRIAGVIHQLPLWPFSFLHKTSCYGGMVSAAAEAPRGLCPGGACAPWRCEEQQMWVAGDMATPGPSPSCKGIRPVVWGPRRRFASQVRRQVLRVRIVGAEPEQLPSDWQERLFAHFNGPRNTSRYLRQPADVPTAQTHLACGVAVRRGSIFMTVSLVQLPSHHDGDDGPGGSGDRRMRRDVAQGGGVVGHRPDQPDSVVRAAGVRSDGHGDRESDPASGTIAAATNTRQAPPLLVQQEQQAGPRCHVLVRTISAGADGCHKHADAASAHGRSIDGRPAGADTHPASATIATVANAAAMSTANSLQSPRCGLGHSSAPMQHIVQRAPDIGGSGLHGASPSGCASGRRRIAGVWRAERHGTFHSASSASTPGNSNNPLHVLGSVQSASLCPGSPLATSFAGQMAGGLVLPAMASPAPGLGLGPGGSQQPMRYTPMLSPTQQVSICSGLGYAPPVCGTNLASYATEPSPGVATVVQMQHRAAGAWPGLASSQTHASVRTGGGTASTSMQVAQLLDAMQLRSRDNTIREARHGCALSVLTAVSQLDGGIPLHLRQVLGTESWEQDDGVSSSWEVDGVYERPQPPLPLAPQQQQARRWAQDLATAAANGLFVLSDAPSPQQLTAAGTLNSGGPSPLLHQHLVLQQAQAVAATAIAADGGGAITPPARGASGDARGVRGPSAHFGFPGTVPLVQPGGATWASVGTVWPSHSAGLAVLADRATLPVRDVAVKPILICKAPLLHAAAAGDLAASIPSGLDTASTTVTPSSLHADSGPDVGNTTAAVTAVPPPSELGLSLICAPATVSELSVMLRYCGPASIFGEQTYLPVQLQLDSASPAVAAAIRLQAAASDRRGGGDTQAARDVAEAATAPLPAHATVRTALKGLACPGVLYVELWHGPQLCACLPVLLLPESAAGWAHEVCNLWQQQAEEGEAAAVVQGRAGAAAMPAAAHQVVEDLGGWLTYAAHKRYVAERAAAMATAATAAAASQPSLGLYQVRYHQAGPTALGDGGFAASSVSTGTGATTSPPLLDEWFSGWLVDTVLTEATTGASALSPPAAATVTPVQNQHLPLLPSRPTAAATPAAAGYYPPYGGSYDAAGAAGGGGVGGACNRELFHDIMLQEGYNWLADCVEAGCCGLAAALMDSLLSAGCSAGEVLRTCRSADGLPLTHAATLSGNPAMMDLVWGWGQATGMDLLSWEPPPRMPPVAAVSAAAATGVTGVGLAAINEPLHGAFAGGPSSNAMAMDTTVVTRNSQPICHTGGAGTDSTERAGVADYDPLSMPLQTRKDSTQKDGDPAAYGGWASWPEIETLMHNTLSDGSHLLASMLSLKVGHAASRLATAAQLMQQTILPAISVACSRRHRQGSGADRVSSSMEGLWQWWREGARRGAASALQMGDAAVMGLHSLVLRVNILHVDGGAEERRFLSHFQERHGWVFSAWCWSMIPVYALILWRYLLERRWGQLMWTPLWMWMYVFCACADVSGATAAYRSRTEALAAAMHLSHTLCKALYCAGLPSYPVPQGRGRLYWMDVLACATLSAICEPVRICVAWPLRLVNFVVSTVLYRVTGTAPTYLEATLLSASCHCFGLLMQHAVESHYRCSFTIMQQDMASGVTAAGAVIDASKSPDDSGTPDTLAPCSGVTAATPTGYAPEQNQRQQPAQPVSSSPGSPPSMSLFISAPDNIAMVEFSTPEPDTQVTGPPEAVTAVSTATATAAAAATRTVQPAADAFGVLGEAVAAPASVAAVAQSETSYGEVWELLERDRAHFPDRDHDRGRGRGTADSSSGAGGYVIGTRCLGSSLLEPRDEVLLADGLWESSEVTGAWPFDHTPTSGALTTCTSASVHPSHSPLRPQGQLSTLSSLPSPREQWRRRQQQRYSRAHMQAQVPEAHGEGQALDLYDSACPEANGRDDGTYLRTSAPLPRPSAQAGTDALHPGTTLAAVPAAASDGGRFCTEQSSAAVGSESNGCGSNTAQRVMSTSTSPSLAHRRVNGSSGGAASGSGSDSGVATGRSSENGGSSDTCSGAASSSRGSGRGSNASGGGRGSGRSLRQLVSRATGWVAGTFRRKSLRIAGPGGRKVTPTS
ncbi:hypothetical protein Vafri_3419 [Volvox africanus]|uniref:Uncharacterized protein n=1 Tax=Volvox africanus TaxID=51714 RepID=A0A8J4ETU4_9CHLO|nr:hypothetical protein Vafri_3419 [Volvox africanus]